MNYLKIIGKILLILVVLLSALLTNFVSVGGEVYAANFFVSEASLKSKGTYSGSITYNGVEITTTYVYYLKDGKEYPAYCISPGVDGVGEYGNYNVSVDSLLTDVSLWRVITNGYPYKSVSELGCNSADEAFVATKHAVYCAILGREASWYGTIGEKGIRVRNAMAQILAAAKQSSSGKPSSNIEINALDTDWVLDSSLPNYISQTFSISASTSYDNYIVSLQASSLEDVKIFDINNNPKTTFNSGEKFKIAIPLNNLNKSGSFKVKVSTKLNTKPVLYGKSPSGSGLQDYALTASIYEDAEGTKLLNYTKNNTALEIIKKDGTTSKALEGVEFKILDSNKKPVYTDLVTNSKGKILVKNIMPGKYYLEEVKTLDGYSKYDKQIEFDIAYNQTLSITVNNSIKKKTEQVTDIQKINVSQAKEEIVVKDNQESTNKTEKEKITNIVNTVKNISENNDVSKEKQNEVRETVSKNASVDQKQDEIITENKNVNYNKLIEDLSAFINNEDINVNKEVKNDEIQINNLNTNLNENLLNQIIKLVNENNNINKNVQNQELEINDDLKNLNMNQNNLKEQTNKKSVNETINKNENIQTNDISIINSNQNENINTQKIEANIQNNNQNLNTNILSYNGVVKLPKTGM